MYDFLGEAAGGRIIGYGQGYGQIGTPYNLEMRTWPYRPFGSDGEGLFRTVTGVIRHTNGYLISLQVIVDDVAYTPSTFGGGPPPGALLEQTVRLPTFPYLRGNRLEVILKSLALYGETEFVDILVSDVPIRLAL